MNNHHDVLMKCPVCRKPVAWERDNPLAPFCSERCQTIDLGAWFYEEYKIPESKTQESWSESEANDNPHNKSLN